MSRPKGSKNKKTLAMIKKNISFNPTIDQAKTTEIVNEVLNKTVSEINKEILPSKNTYICDRCHKITIGNPAYINLSYLTRVSSWFREIKPDKITLCRECCLGFSAELEKFLINDNKGVELKFPVQFE